MKILYFSWLREKVGLHEQIIVKPKNVNTIIELITVWAGRNLKDFQLPTDRDDEMTAFSSLKRQLKTYLGEIRNIQY